MELGCFKTMVRSFYQEQGRDFPWRYTSDPYAIAVSEFMLQQTRTEVVEKKFIPFLQAFPSIDRLATASLADLFERWKGLGYNRRVLYLQEFARTVVGRWEGSIPKNPALLQQCRGVGVYTSRAIQTFAFNAPLVFLETNIRRVFIHHFFPAQPRVHDRDILPWVARALDWENPREWYYALMDYGGFLGKILSNPNHRSLHFSRQSPFQGSFRQLRGQILSLLLQTKEGSPLRTLEQKTNFPAQTIRDALQKLITEGFVAEEEGIYFLR